MSLDYLAVFAAGLLTLVTPCVLPLIPIYLALLVGESSSGKTGRFTTASSTLAFSLGMITVFVALGLAATAVGALLNAHRPKLVLFGGLVILLFGLKLLGLLRVPWLDRERRLDGDRLASGHRLLNALLMGIVFSLGWTPCVGPILGSVLTYTASRTSDPWTGAAYLAVFGIGFTLPLMGLALFADAARKLIRKVSRALPTIERVTGALLVVAGLVMMADVVTAPRGSRSAAAVVSHQGTIAPPIGQPSHRPRLVQFTSSSCSICRQMIPTVAVVERDCGGQHVDVLKLDVEIPQNRQLATKLRIRGVPTFVFLDTQGHEVARLVGYQRLSSLRQALAAAVGRQCAGLGTFRPSSQDCERSGSIRCESGEGP